MLSRVTTLLLLLILTVPTIACSAKPSKAEFNKVAFDGFSKKCHYLNSNCKLENDRAFWQVTGWSNGIDSDSFYYFIGTNILKNNKEEEADMFPYLGTAYYLGYYGGAKGHSKLRDESFRRSLEERLSKLKIEDVKNIDPSQGIEINGFKFLTYTLDYRWGKKTKVWQ